MPRLRLQFAETNAINAMLAGEWTAAGLRKRLRLASQVDGRNLNKFIRQLLKHFPNAAPTDPRPIAEFLRTTANWMNFWNVSELFWSRSEMSPRREAADWAVPPLRTPLELAAWLDMPLRKLQWFADVRGRNPNDNDSQLQHYRHRWQRKPSGGWRLLEIPKSTLKKLQRKILDEILRHVPAHDAAHGFCHGRNVASYVAPQVGQTTVLRFDLRDFFPSTPSGRVEAVFRFVGYPSIVARMLTGLCTTRMSSATWQTRPAPQFDGSEEPTRQLFEKKHLPQGSPTSPALANLCAYRLDVRLSKLASSLGAKYTRYADDLAISGSATLHSQAKRLRVLIGIIAAEEGYVLNYRKCRTMPQSTQQHLAGVVVNDRPNLRRDEYDRLKATLHNCLRNSPATQNRDSHPDFQNHLLGRIGWVKQLNPVRGDKLLQLFRRIDWNLKPIDS